MVNYAFLAIQGHIRRVTHSYKHVSPWVSLLLILSGDVSINPGPNTNLLTGSLINIRSIRNKSVALTDFINSNKSDIIAVTETWLRPDDTDRFIASVTPPGYKCTHVPHPERRGGGVGFFIRDDIDFKVLPQPCFNTFESISVHLSTGNAQDIVFHTVYRPPNVSKANFIEDFSSLWREAVAGIVFSNDLISNCMNYATYWFIRFTIAIFYNIYSPFQQISVLISLIFP